MTFLIVLDRLFYFLKHNLHIAQHFITDKKHLGYFKKYDVLFMKHYFEKYNSTIEPNSSLYIDKGNRDIVNLCISILIYSIEFKNQTENQDEFVTLKNFKVHNTQYTEVFAHLVTINGKIYVGLQRKSYNMYKTNPSLKSILLPIEAWTTIVSQEVTMLDKAIKEYHANKPPPTETPTWRKRPYSNCILTLNIFTMFNFRSFYSSSVNNYSSFVIFSFFYILNHAHNFGHIVVEIFLISHLIGRAKQNPRGGMKGGIRGYYGSRVAGGDAITPRTSIPIPDRNPDLAQDSHLGLSSTSISTKRKRLQLNTDSLVNSGLATTSRSLTGWQR